MDFLKKNYEKVILGVVLIGLAVAAGLLPFQISNERQMRADLRNNKLPANVKPLTNINTAPLERSLGRITTPATIDFSPPNKLFNPLPWKKTPDENIIPATQVGPTSLTITNIQPLYLRLTLDSITASDSGVRYVVGVTKESAPTATLRRKKQTYVSLNQKTDTFVLVEVKGKPEDPSQLIVELLDSGERVPISREKPYERTDGYVADLRYDPEKRAWTGQRVGSSVSFGGEDYNIVAILPNEIVLSARSNQKKWTIKHNPNPTPAT